jgi:hypothetical protein
VLTGTLQLRRPPKCRRCVLIPALADRSLQHDPVLAFATFFSDDPVVGIIAAVLDVYYEVFDDISNWKNQTWLLSH